MKRYFLIFITLMFMGPLHAQYSSQWKQVESFEKESLPKSALEIVEKIYQEALQNNNSAEVIKSLIYQLKLETVISRNKYPDMIKEVETFAAETNNKTEQALLYSLLAGLYKNYYFNSAPQSTAITGFTPEDIREWPANIFIQKIYDLVDLSLVPALELQQTPALEYAAILREGESSRKLRPTLYDFIINEGINNLSELNFDYRTSNYYTQNKITDKSAFAPLEQFLQWNIEQAKYDFSPKILFLYQQLLSFRNKDNNSFALLIVDLERLDFVNKNYIGETRNKFYEDALENLKNKYASSEYVIEIMYQEAVNYLQNSYNSEEGTKNPGAQKAYEICLSGIKQYPNYERIGLLKNLLNQLTNSRLNVYSDNVVYPGEGLTLKINYQNYDKIEVEIYKINSSVTIYPNAWDRKGQYKKNGKLLKKEVVNLPKHKPYETGDTTIILPLKELGNYEYVIKTDKYDIEPANQQFSVSRLGTLARTTDGKRDFIVVDRVSGLPVENAQINLYTRSNEALRLNKTFMTNSLGIAQDEGNQDIAAYNVISGEDKYLLTSFAPWISTYENRNKNNNALNIFTDRSIYRPGQTVYFKGIAYDKKNTTILQNNTYTVSFYDANNKEISSQDLTTNEYGSFSGEFVIPQGLLTGSFSIRSKKDNGYAYIQVEEYKRPTFDIKFDKNEKAYSFGDKVALNGNVKTFSGVNLQDAKVNYRITRYTHWLYRGFFRSPVQVAQGTILTNEQGEFEISFVPDKSFEDKDNIHAFYSYSIEATVTNTNGESQTTSTQINIGTKSMYLSLEGIENILKKEDPKNIRINAMNLSGNKTDAAISYEIFKLDIIDLNQLDGDDNNWKKGRLISTGTIQSGEEIKKEEIKSLASGKYRIIAKAKDTQNREIDVEEDFVLASEEDKLPPIPTYKWVMKLKTDCEPGEKAEILLGSSAQNVSVLYEIYKDKKKLSASRFTLNKENKKIEIPFLESYGEGVTVSFTYVKDKKIFSESIEVRRKETPRILTLNMEIFRDYLLPGQKEEWKIAVKDDEKNPVLAEILAGMYDSSLDKIQNHSWNFRPVDIYSLWRVSNRAGNEFESSNSWLSYTQKEVEIPNFSYDSFNLFGLNPNAYILYRQSNMRVRGALSGYGSARDGGIDIADLAENKVLVQASESLDSEVIVNESEVTEGSADRNVMEDSSEDIQIRQNFNETAFFYPQLKTNEKGETVISFTVPESNTTWKFMALAHTKDLKYGQLIKEAISQKKLMVNPNIPRFIREGDKMTISSTISNLSEENISGKVSIEFFDPATNKKQIQVNEASKAFSVESGKTIPVSWSFEVPEGIELTSCKIIAKSPNFSDGEQHLIPVLPNKLLVTESLSLSLSGKGKKEYTFDKLANPSSTLENYRLTLEFSNNPAWYAVQALPSVTVPQSENIISWAGAYYSNVMATYIANSTPRIKQLIDIWTKQTGTKETLLSNLEKNQELKNIVLEETPWILEAKNETEQMKQLSLLFDLNRSANLNNEAANKLIALQNFDGGWSWFKGIGRSNTSITQWILYCLGELSRLEGFNHSDEIKQMEKSAIRFVDSQIKQQYENLKKYDTNWKQKSTVSIYELEYLLTRSYYGEPILPDVQEAKNFYLTIAKNNWASTKSLYERAITATILLRSGNKEMAQNIIKSLREHATSSPELGMYWDNNEAHPFMTQSATLVHTFIMQAFKEAGAGIEEMNEMKLWLLKQKQTQQWESVPATVASINILLSTGSDWLANEGNTQIKFGKQKIDTKEGISGIGYVKKTYEASSIKKEMAKVEIAKSNEGPAWGALYWQYFEDLDKITEAKTDLNVEKGLYIEQVTNTGKSLIPVSESNSLKVGDKVTVRLTIRTSRDMEYVHLKDMRASCFEPTEQLSGNQWKQGLFYYQAPKDASMNFYFNAMPKGTYVLEYNLYVTSSGNYSNGITTIQCMYAPEYVSHSSGNRIIVE